MNKLSTQKFMTLFNDMLCDQKGTKIAEMFKAETKGDEVDQVNFDRDQLLFERLNGRNLLFMKKVERAKQKIIDGTFGECEECGAQISQKRLLARPTAALCIGCQEEKERNERGSINHRRDLKLLGTSKRSGSSEIEMEEEKNFNLKDIKFESIVEV